MLTTTYTIYSSNNTNGLNTLCFEAWAQSEAPKVGVLIDDVVIAKQDVRYVSFYALPSAMDNIIVLYSNLTVDNDT